MPRTAIVTPSICRSLVWKVLAGSRGSMPGRLWALSRWACDQSGPRERSSSLATTRSPSSKAERAPIRAMRGSEPGSSHNLLRQNFYPEDVVR